MRYTIEMTHKLLKENGLTEKDLKDRCNYLISYLEKKIINKLFLKRNTEKLFF